METRKTVADALVERALIALSSYLPYDGIALVEYLIRYAYEMGWKDGIGEGKKVAEEAFEKAYQESLGSKA